MSKLTENVAFDFIRYANCWEDADILGKALSPKAGSKILSIGSAGDNSFSMLLFDPELVVAVDVNKTQLFLIELKKIIMQAFDYEQVITFLGFRQNKNRVARFNQIKSKLSIETRQYWEQNIAQIERGVINEGKFEKYFQKFSRYVLPLIHSKTTAEKLLMPKSATEQAAFYDEQWNTWRWRLLFKIFFSKYVMGKYGRDPEFLKQVNISVGEFIFQRAEQHLKSTHAQNNFILRYNLMGSFGFLLPNYLQPENFDKIKQNLSKLHIFEGYAEAAIEKFGTFDSMNLSNIFEYMDADLFQKTASSLVEGTNAGGRLAYWNLMVPRRISSILPNETNYLNDLSTQLSQEDKGFFYGGFFVDEKK
jgi:S-adenosylmethionine-diacylglycerol 3-amino-3-carboxypropyl transferase